MVGCLAVALLTAPAAGADPQDLEPYCTGGGTAVYLASDYGACTTGEIVRVDGGYHVLGMPQPENL